MLQVRLKPGLPGGHWACLRRLCGHDEAFVDGTSSIVATYLIDRLLVDLPGTTVVPGKTWQLAVCDRDRLLAIVYLQCFGERVESSIACVDCNKPFVFTFSLRELMSHIEDDKADDVIGPDEDGIYALVDGPCFRLPTGADQCNVMEFEPEVAAAALVKRCLVNTDCTADPKTVETAMAKAGPMLDGELDATCPDCGTQQSVRFDIQSYLLRSLSYERRFLSHEVHRIAMAYGWSYDAILNLPRDDRRNYVRLIESHHTARRIRLQ